MRYHGRLRAVADGRGVWERIAAAVPADSPHVLVHLAEVPVYLSDRSVRRLGSCSYGPRQALGKRAVEKITVSSRHWYREREGSTDTLLHETAHALKHLLHGPGRGRVHGSHGVVWRGIAGRIGANPNRANSSAEARKEIARRTRVVAICHRCGTELRRLRALPRNRDFEHVGCGGRFVAQ